jgi:hypothetical protein
MHPVTKLHFSLFKNKWSFTKIAYMSETTASTVPDVLQKGPLTDAHVVALILRFIQSDLNLQSEVGTAFSIRRAKIKVSFSSFIFTDFNDELHWMMRWVGHVARMGEGRGVYRVLVGRPEGKRPLGRPRHRWEDNIRMDLREVRIDGANWIQLAQDRVQWRA